MQQQPISGRRSILEKSTVLADIGYKVKYNRDQVLTRLQRITNSVNTATIIIDRNWLSNDADEANLLFALNSTMQDLQAVIDQINSGKGEPDTFRTLADIARMENETRRNTAELDSFIDRINSFATL